jgi:hypothetical protein
LSWANINNVLSFDTTPATVSFTGAQAGLSGAYPIHVQGFGFTLPTTAVIEGIEVSVVKRLDSGSLEDFVGLVYNYFGTLFSSNQIRTLGAWPSVYTNVTYGGPTDTWGTISMWNGLGHSATVNHPSFGVNFKANCQSPSGGTGSIDYVEMTVYYHNLYSQTTTGGGVLDGVAAVESVKNPVLAAGGAVADGHGATDYNVTATTDGPVGNGSAVVTSGLFMEGGSVLDVTSGPVGVYNIGPQPYTWNFRCNGDQNVPPVPEEAHVAEATVTLDPGSNTLSWDITHTFADPEAVRFRGPAEYGVIGPTILSLENFGSTASPIRGSASVTLDQQADIQSGLWYLFIRKTAGNNFIRGQVSNTTGRMLASASVSFFSPSAEEGSGGVTADGTDNSQFTYNPPSLSGAFDGGFDDGFDVALPIVIADGEADAQFVFNPQVTGGTTVSGLADVLKQSPEDSTGGVYLDATAGVTCVYAAASETDGPLVNGSSIGAISVPVGDGGGAVGGAAAVLWVATVSTTGGAAVSGSYLLQQTYAAQPIRGGLRVIGGWASAVKRPRTTNASRNVALMMKSPNRLNTVTTEPVLRNPNRSLDPAMEAVPPVRLSPFSYNHSPGWSDYTTRCDAPILPKIIQVRQRGYLPPKCETAVVSGGTPVAAAPSYIDAQGAVVETGEEFSDSFSTDFS